MMINKNQPLLTMGDFNTMLEVDDRINGNLVQATELRDFREFIKDNGVIKMKYVGRRYTWTDNHTSSKIDWMFCNKE